MPRHGGAQAVNMGGTAAAVLFILALLGFVAETQLTQVLNCILNLYGSTWLTRGEISIVCPNEPGL